MIVGYVAQGQLPTTMDIEPDSDGHYLSELQRLVEGRIEAFDVLFGEEPVLFVNDEGVFTKKPNRVIIATEGMAKLGYLSQIDGDPVEVGEPYTILFGPIVAVSHDEGGKMRSLTEDEAQRFMDYFSKVVPYSVLDGRFIIRPC